MSPVVEPLLPTIEAGSPRHPPGLTAFLGVNNSGKSSLLRLFFELRNLIGTLSGSGNLIEALRGNRQGLGLVGVLDHSEIFPRGNHADAEITFAFEADVTGVRRSVNRVATVHRDGVAWTARLDLPMPFDRTSLTFRPPSSVLYAGDTSLVADDRLRNDDLAIHRGQQMQQAGLVQVLNG